MSLTMNKLTKAVSELEINERDSDGDKPQRPTHKHQHSSGSMAKLLTKYAAPVPTQHSQGTNAALRMALTTQPTNYTHVPKGIRPVSSTSNLKSQIPSPKKPTTATKHSQIDIGKYDGGLELENDKRGSAVSGEAALQLALDSSVGR